LRSFQKRFSEFTARGVHIAAISIDSVDINRGMLSKCISPFHYSPTQTPL